MKHKKFRRRGTAIVKTRKGILLTAGKKGKYDLPGGGTNYNEGRREAVIRELKEETGLKTKSSKFLFCYKDDKPGYYDKRNFHKVFLLKTNGRAKPNMNDVFRIAYWKKGSHIPITSNTRKILNKFNELKKNGRK